MPDDMPGCQSSFWSTFSAAAGAKWKAKETGIQPLSHCLRTSKSCNGASYTWYCTYYYSRYRAPVIRQSSGFPAVPTKTHPAAEPSCRAHTVKAVSLAGLAPLGWSSGPAFGDGKPGRPLAHHRGEAFRTELSSLAIIRSAYHCLPNRTEGKYVCYASWLHKPFGSGGTWPLRGYPEMQHV